jgi:hypothetical protein
MSDSGHQAGVDAGATPAPTHAEAQNAALDAVEPERLLEGEDEETTYRDDAIHWTKVYTELLEFKRSLLSVAEQRVSSMSDDAGAEVMDTDLKVLTAEAARFERRLAFWQARTDELASPSVTDSE